MIITREFARADDNMAVHPVHSKTRPERHMRKFSARSARKKSENRTDEAPLKPARGIAASSRTGSGSQKMPVSAMCSLALMRQR